MDWTISVTLLRIELFLVGVFNILWKKALFARFPVSSYKKRDNFSWYCEQDIASRPAMSAFFCVGISFPTRLPWCPRFGDRVRHKSHQQTIEKIKCSFSSDGFFLVFLVRARPGMTTRPGQLGKAFIKIHKGRLFSSDFPSRVMRTKTFQTFPLAPQTVLWVKLKKMFLSLKTKPKTSCRDPLHDIVLICLAYPSHLVLQN